MPTPKRWHDVNAMLDRILAIPDGERPALLDELRRDDSDLYHEVASLLDHADDECWLDRPLWSVHDDDPDLGRQVGPYELRQLLGRGGMGAVYLAARRDDYRREVAVKLVKRGMDSDEIVRRFRNERQILAGLDHPCIARLLDGGTTDDGRLYLVMEYIEGEPIDRYCDARRLGVRRRLELFLEVCEAVQLAHRNLVVHRDLKPDNILVTAEGGEPKLLDFGIAKLLDPGSGATVLATAANHGPMTRRWASPEQIRGAPVTTATDIYSLGVLLYRLLTGHHPNDLEGCTTTDEEMNHRITSVDPRRPSTVVAVHKEIHHRNGTVTHVAPEEVGRCRDTDTRGLRRRLAGDLDAIVLKALRKEPERRYGSVVELAEDARRHLVGLPVEARSGTHLYRAGKFVRRHRLALGIAVVFTALVLGFTATQVVSLERTARERDRADQLSASLAELVRALEPSTPEQEKRGVGKALDQVTASLYETLGDHPLDQATLLDLVGRTYRRYEFYEKARPLLEKALELRRESLGEEHALVGESLHNLALVLRKTGRGEEAEPLLRRSLEIARQHPHDRQELAWAENELGMLLYDRKEYGEAKTCFRRALETWPEPDGELHPRRLRIESNLAGVLMVQERYAEAETIYRRSLRIRRDTYGPESEEAADSLNQLGNCLFYQERLDEAEQRFRESLAIRRQLYGADHGRVSTILVSLGRLLSDQRRFEEAVELYREAVEIREARYGPDHPRTLVARQGLEAVLAASGQSGSPAGEGR